MPQRAPMSAITPEQRKNNRRLGLILAAIAVMVFVAFMLKGVFGGL
jgi:hypothetical protein